MSSARREVGVEVCRIVDDRAADLDVRHSEQARYSVLLQRAFSDADVISGGAGLESPATSLTGIVRQIAYSCVGATMAQRKMWQFGNYIGISWF